MIPTDNTQEFEPQQTWDYDLKRHKELLYIKRREGERGGDYGYTEPYSQGDQVSCLITVRL